ncbi:MAG: CsbD family protein [Saprospiraceae bacterium]|nr:CsbD family protein [Saprospiraceae bacterium]
MDNKSIKMRLEGNWKKVKGTFKEKYGQLTEDDFLVEEGQTEQWIGKMQDKLGKTRQEIVNEIEAITA